MKSQRSFVLIAVAALAASAAGLFPATVVLAATWTAASCSYTDVSNAIGEASSGDTVIVPAGSATYNSSLVIAKGIIFKGAGIDQTTITANFTTQYYGIFTYEPANPSLNEPFRITGFTLNGNNLSNCLVLNNTATTSINQIRVNHCKFLNAGGGGNCERTIFRYGLIYGVYDSNTFQGGIITSTGVGQGQYDWQNESLTYGTANNIFYEDNTMTVTALGVFTDGTMGGRYVLRYNNVNSTVSDYPCFDAHGNMIGSDYNEYSMMVMEIYGNQINMGSNRCDLYDQRGGNSLVFFNQVTSGQSCYFQVRDEYNQYLTDPNYVQEPNNSYYWNNRYNGTLFGTSVPINETGTATGGGSNYLSVASASSGLQSGCYGIGITSGTGAGQCANITGGTSTTYTVSPNWTTIPDSTSKYAINEDWQYNGLVENVNFFNDQTPNFNGTVGCGCGPLSSRPSTCTVGVGYWATNQTCTQVSSANCGVRPSAPISGTFYKCTATNTWQSYYTPYTYPHPLRVSGPVADSPPSAPPAVYDGTTTGVETSTTTSTTQLSANWTAASDPINGISGYQYAIGTTAGGTNVVAWTSLGNVLSVTKTGLSLTVGTTYYFSVKAVSGLGIVGPVTSSPGCKVVSSGTTIYFQDNFEGWAVYGGAWSLRQRREQQSYAGHQRQLRRGRRQEPPALRRQLVGTIRRLLDRELQPRNFQRYQRTLLRVSPHRIWDCEFDL